MRLSISPNLNFESSRTGGLFSAICEEVITQLYIFNFNQLLEQSKKEKGDNKY